MKSIIKIHCRAHVCKGKTILNWVKEPGRFIANAHVSKHRTKEKQCLKKTTPSGRILLFNKQYHMQKRAYQAFYSR